MDDRVADADQPANKKSCVNYVSHRDSDSSARPPGRADRVHIRPRRRRIGGDYEIYAVDLTVAGATPAALTSNALDDFTPSWSPDGTKIAWTSHPGGGRADVFSMNANGLGQQNLTNSPGADDFEPSWGLKPPASLPREGMSAAVVVMLPLVGRHGAGRSP